MPAPFAILDAAVESEAGDDDRLGEGGERGLAGGTRDVAVRAGAVSLVGMLVAVGFGALTLSDLAQAGVAVTDLLPLVAFPFLVAALTALVHRRTRRGRVWAFDRARWMFAGVTTVAAFVAVVLLALLSAVGFDAAAPPAEQGHVLDVALVLVVGVVVFTGLPLWVFVLGALVGPGVAVGRRLDEDG